jgi:glutaminase
VDEKESLSELVDLFFQLCSVETTCQSLAAIAATMANNGTCPLTNKCVPLQPALPSLNAKLTHASAPAGPCSRNAVSKAAVAQTVQILNMTDKWAQNLNLAAKSSLSGAILGARTPLPPQTVVVCQLG